MKTKAIRILCFLLILGSNNIFSQQEGEMKLSLKDAIAYAIKNNYDNQIAEKDVAKAKEKKWETTTTGLPQIDGKLDYQYWLKQRVSVFPASFADPFSQLRLLDNFYDLNALKKAPLPDVPTQSAAFPIGTKQSIDASVTLKQLIFSGSYLVGLQSAKTYLKISEQAKQKTALATREAVINAYGNILVTQESMKVLEKNKTNLETIINDTKKLYDNGLTEQESYEQLQITLGTIENSLRNVKRMQLIAYQMLNIALGNKSNRKLNLTDTLSDLTEKNTDLALLSKTFNINNHIDYKMALNNKEAKGLMLKLEKSKYLPTLSGFINYGVNANSNEFSFFDSDQDWFDYALAGISLNVPIFSSFGRSSKSAQAKIALEQADIKLQQIAQKLSLQAAQSKSEYQLSIENLATAKQNLALAERIENKNQIKFKEGLASSFDLRQAQTQLFTQQNEYIQSMLDVISKKAKLETALNLPIK